jgi:putative ABC transport system permease protein
MSVTWRKVWRDLTQTGNRARTVLAVLSIAVGVFALGMIYGTYDIICSRLAENQRATVPVHMTFWRWRFDYTAEEAVLHEPGIADVEKLVDSYILWKLEGDKYWHTANLIARVDYEKQRMGLVNLVSGHWPTKRTLAVERQTARYFNVPLGAIIVVQSGLHEQKLSVEGIVCAYDRSPPQDDGTPAFYATPETVTWLTGDEFNRLDVRMASYSQAGAPEIAKHVRDRLDNIGSPVNSSWVRDPNKHWFQTAVDTMLIILMVLGVLLLGMSAFLIVTTVNAIVAQQVWQIGVMKVVGATFGRVVRVYLTITLIYSGLALLLAVPLGAIGAHLLAKWLLDQHANITIVPFEIRPMALGIQLAVGLVVPQLAGLAPIVGGARITPRQAISTYGLGGEFGSNWLDRLFGKIRSLPRPMALSLRNTFRRKARVTLTLVTLALGGAIFMMVMSVTGSFTNTIETLIRDTGADATVWFGEWYRVERMVKVAENLPGVVGAEAWQYEESRLKSTRGPERLIALWGIPPSSKVYAPRIVSGRGLLPGDDHAILLNYKIASEEGVQVGDEINFRLRDQETTWTVIGLVVHINEYYSYVPFEALSREIGKSNLGYRVDLVSDRHTADYQQRLVEDLREAYTANHMVVTWAWTSGEMRVQRWQQFSNVVYLLLTMAILAAVVGGIGIMSTMSINVVERRREIGVMRATGATSAAIAGIFIGEGMLLGVLSWLLAAPFSYPGGRLFSDMVGKQILGLPLDFSYSWEGVLLWLMIVSVLSALASLWPALQATRISIREALVYE